MKQIFDGILHNDSDFDSNGRSKITGKKLIGKKLKAFKERNTKQNKDIVTLKEYQEKAKKYDLIVSLAAEENKCRSRIKQIAQERAKLLGVVGKYK